MALAKSRVSIWSSQTLTAGAANTTSSSTDLTASYGNQLDISIINGATGPTIAGQCQIQVAADAAGTLFVNYGGALVAVTTNSATTSWSVELPIGVGAVQLVAGSNTAQNVTINADLSKVTSL